MFHECFCQIDEKSVTSAKKMYKHIATLHFLALVSLKKFEKINRFMELSSKLVSVTSLKQKFFAIPYGFFQKNKIFSKFVLGHPE